MAEAPPPHAEAALLEAMNGVKAAEKGAVGTLKTPALDEFLPLNKSGNTDVPIAL